MGFKVDLLFEISVPRPWDGGKERARYHEALEQGVFAEAMGFSTAWIVEHHFLTELAHSSAPDAFLGALAARTSTIGIGLGVTLLPGPVNHPIRVAERCATLDIVSDGRLQVGTGRSSSPYQLEAFGVDIATTREQWEESIKLLPQLWTKEAFSYEGNFWSWKDEITVVPRPVQQPHPPLWVAATQPETCRVAGEKGVGLLLTAVQPPEGLAEEIRTYKEAVANPIDQVGAFKNDECSLFTLAFCNDDDDKARQIGGAGGIWYLHTVQSIFKNDWRGTPIGSVPESYRYHARRQSGNWAAQADTTMSAEDLIDSGAFCVGDPASVLERAKRYIDVGGQRLICVMQTADLAHEDIMRSIELFGQKVIPGLAAYEAERAAAIPETVR